MQGEKPVSVTDAWDYARSIGAKYVESSSRTKVSSRGRLIGFGIVKQITGIESSGKEEFKD